MIKLAGDAMRLSKLCLAAGMFAMLAAPAAWAQERGTPDEAKALVERAAKHLHAVGPEKAIPDFKDPKGGYQDRDLFVFAYGPDLKILPAGGPPALTGRDATALKDVDGKEFGKAIIAAAEAGGGWVEYRMANPATKKTEAKKTYAVKVDGYVLGSGAYKQ